MCAYVARRAIGEALERNSSLRVLDLRSIDLVGDLHGVAVSAESKIDPAAREALVEVCQNRAVQIELLL